MKTLAQLTVVAFILTAVIVAGELIHYLVPVNLTETIPVNKALLAVAILYFWEKQDKR